jgi:hypothetical protein
MNGHTIGDFDDDAITEVIPHVDDLMRAKYEAHISGEWPSALCKRCGRTRAKHGFDQQHSFE